MPLLNKLSVSALAASALLTYFTHSAKAADINVANTTNSIELENDNLNILAGSNPIRINVDNGNANITSQGDIDTARDITLNLSFGSGNLNLAYTANLGDGDNTILVGSVADVYGLIISGAGNDELNVSSLGYLHNDINLGDGNNIFDIGGSGSNIFEDILFSSGSGTDLFTLDGTAARDDDGQESYVFGVSLGAGNDKFTLDDIEVSNDDDNFDLGAGNDEVQFTNVNYTDGELLLGADNDKATFQDSTIAAIINAGEGDDEITFTSTSLSADSEIQLGNGNDKLTISGSTIAGDISAGTGPNTITLNSLTLTGDLNLATGNDIVTVNSSNIISNAIVLGDGTNTLTFNSATSTGGTITGGTGTNTLNFNNSSSSAAITLSGTGILNLSSGSEITGSVSGVDQLTISDSSTITGALTFDAGADVTVNNITNSATLATVYAQLGSVDNFTANNSTLTGTLNFGTSNDTLTFNNSNIAALTINAGDGNDILNLNNSSTNSLIIDAGNGADTLNILGSTSSTLGTLTSIETFNHNSTGTTSLSSGVSFATETNINSGTFELNTNTLTSTTVNVNDGATLQATGGATISGAVNFNSGSTLASDFNDTLTVTGVVNQTSSHLALSANRFIEDGEVETILTATGGTIDDDQWTAAFEGDILNVNLTASDANNLIATVSRNSYTSLSNNTTVNEGLTVLEAYGPTAAGDDLEQFNGLDRVSSSNFDQAASQVTGTVHANNFQALNTITNTSSKTIFNRIGELRANQGFGAPTGAFGAESSEENLNNVWFKTSLSDGTQDTDSGIIGYDFDSTNYTFGYDRTFGDWVIGAALSYGEGTADFDNGSGSSDIDSYSGAIYLSQRFESFYWNSNFIIGASTTDTTRIVSLPGFTGSLGSEADSQNLGLNFQMGYDLPFESFTLTPIAGFSFNKVEIDGYEESGTGISLQVDDQEYDSFKSQLGGRISFINDMSSTLSHSVELHSIWNHELMDEESSFTAQYAGIGDSFTVTGSGGYTDVIDSGIAYKIQHKDVTFNLAYSYEFSDTYKGNNLSATIGVQF